MTGTSVAVVVVVNYNAGALLSESVRDVLASTVPVEVFVVDNGSSDDSIKVLRDRIGPDPRLSIIETGRNLGFAKAANIALRRATADYSLILNPDCLVLPDTLEKVINAVLLDPEIGVAGCLIRNPDRSEQAGGRRSVPTPWRSFVRVLNLDKWMPANPLGRKNWMFCWTELGAKHVGIMQSLIVTCRLHQIDPYDYLVDVLQRVGQHPASRAHELTPRLWKKIFAGNPLRSPLHTIPAQ